MTNTHSLRLRRTILAMGAGLVLVSPAARGQAGNACDLNGDKLVDFTDVQLATNMALGLSPCTAKVFGSLCNAAMVQRVTNAALGGPCLTDLRIHTVSLSWTASVSADVIGYHVYRSTKPDGPYARLNPAPVAGTMYTDSAVQGGQVYYYVITAIDDKNAESECSKPASATVPLP